MMRLKAIALISVALISSCTARAITQNAISSILQEIMSPANTDKAMQLINMAATGSNKKVAMPDISRALFANNDCLPQRSLVARNDLPLSRRLITNEMGLPRAIITNDGMARMLANDPRIMYPEMAYSGQRPVIRRVVKEAPGDLFDSFPMPIEYQSVPATFTQERTYPYLPPGPSLSNYSPLTAGPNPYLSAASPTTSPYLPGISPSFNPYLPSVPTTSSYLPGISPGPNPYLPSASPGPNPYLPSASPTTSPYLPELPLASSPFSPSNYPNPYLPAASPISAMSVFPPPTQSKGQFLRKIPIPPPCL